MKRNNNNDNNKDDEIYKGIQFGDFAQYMRNKRRKLLIQDGEINKRSAIFNGLIIHINGYTDPSQQVLRKIIVENGGKYHQFLHNKTDVTHIIASNLTPRKRIEFKNTKVCIPEWITDSANEGRLLPWQNYILDKDKSPQKRLFDFDKPNEHAVNLLQSDDWRNANTAHADTFLQSYFGNSRLHFLSSSKEHLKLLVQSAQENVDCQSFATSNNVRDRNHKDSKSTTMRTIMHVDMDSFFVSASLSLPSNDHLRQLPVAISHAKSAHNSTSEIASCNYKAREYGLANGMFLSTAKRLCPDLIALPYDFDLYNKITIKLYEIFLSNSDQMQAVSVDEALLDVSKRVDNGDHDKAVELAHSIRNKVRQSTNCEASVGIGSNILLAKIATKKAKPAGVYHLKDEMVIGHLSPLPFDILPGVGYEINRKIMSSLDVSNIGELRTRRTLGDLQRLLGKKLGEIIWKASHGIDERSLEIDKKRQSVSAEVNYGIRFENKKESEKFMFNLSIEVSKRLRSINAVGKSMNLKIMTRRNDAPREAPKFLGHGIVDVQSKSCDLNAIGGGGTSDQDRIFECAWKTLMSFNKDCRELRGVGLQIHKLDFTNTKSTHNQIEALFKKQRDESSKSTTISHSSKKHRKPIDLSSDEEENVNEKYGKNVDDVSHSTTMSPTTEANKSDQGIHKNLLDNQKRTAFKFRTPFKIPLKTPVKNNLNQASQASPSLPAPTQTDPSVWKELPSQIRRDIIQDHNYLKSLRTPEKKKDGVEPKATPSVNMVPSQADPTVWKELPSTIRKEIISERQQQKQPLAQPVASSSSPSLMPTQTDPNVWKELPSTIKKCINEERIQIKSKNKNNGRTISKPKMTMKDVKYKLLIGEITNEEYKKILELKLDLDVYFSLPKSVRKEVNNESINKQKNISAVNVNANINRAKELIVVKRQPPPKLMKKTDINDILDVFQMWLETFKSQKPHRSDVERVKNFLIKCLDKTDGRCDGLDKVTLILKLWKRTNGEHFNNCKDTNNVAKCWFITYDEVKCKVDEIIYEQYGYKLKI